MAFARPPRPPRWRDFVNDDPSSLANRGATPKRHDVTFNHHRSTKPAVRSRQCPEAWCADVTHAVTSHASDCSAVRHHGATSKRVTRSSRLRRTNSQAVLVNLPKIEPQTMTLAQTHPSALGIQQDGGDLDLEETQKKCSAWLERVEMPNTCSDIDFEEGSGDELEIPEETYLDLGAVVKPPIRIVTSSQSGSGSRDVRPKVRDRQASLLQPPTT